MGHPALSHEQQRNPVRLEKNIIVTGPNAAGNKYLYKVNLNQSTLGSDTGYVSGLMGFHTSGGRYFYLYAYSG